MDEIEFSEGDRAADDLAAAVSGRKMIPSSYHWCDWCEGMRGHGSNDCPNKRMGETSPRRKIHPLNEGRGSHVPHANIQPPPRKK